ncbi:MAG: galactokinase family protein [Nitrososphaeria archaeon]
MHYYKILKRFQEECGCYPSIVVSSPGRLDFLNTHQDYKGLPVVSVGINLRTYTAAITSKESGAEILSLNMKDEGKVYMDKFDLNNIGLKGRPWFGDYLRASLTALFKKGFRVEGFKALIYSEVPIGSGLGSSAALTVSFIGSINELFGLNLSKKDIAEIAYHAEHDIMGIPCGRLDQYGSTFGKILKIETKPPYNVEELSLDEGIFVVLDSGIKHSTAEIHPKRQEEINLGLKILTESQTSYTFQKKLGKTYYETLWEEISEEEIIPYLNSIPKKSRDRIEFTIKEHKSTLLALKIIKGEIVDKETLYNTLGNKWKKHIENAFASKNPRLKLIGIIMNQQHELLRDLYELSLPQIEKIIDSVNKAGALGAKISGAGLGGSIIALSEDMEVAKKILKEGIKGGAKRGWIAKVDTGIRKDWP